MTIPALVICVPMLDPTNIPYGPAVVSGILQHNGYSSQVWDLNVDLHEKFQPSWHDLVSLFGVRGYVNPVASKELLKKVTHFTKAKLREKISNAKPEVVLLSVFSSQSIDFVIHLTNIIRQLLPDTYIILGGRGLDNIDRATQTTIGNLYIQHLPVDCVYIGDAENNLINVLTNRYQGVFESPPVNSTDLDNCPLPSWVGYEFEKYQAIKVPVTGSKGCVKKCTFCDVENSWPNYVYRKGANIAKEIIKSYQEIGVNEFEFTDNLINGSIKNFREMNKVLAEELPNTISYKGYAICRPKNEFPAEDFVVAKTAGASVFKIGIESGSEKVRRDMKKMFTNDDIAWFAENCYKNKIKQVWLMFCGYPTETEEDFQQSLNLLEQYKHMAKDKMLMIFLSMPMMLNTGSGFMRKYQEEYGLAHNQADSWSDFFWTSSKYTENTFDVRVDRWKRFVSKIYECGYNTHQRQDEKFAEIEGLEKFYREKYGNRKIIGINRSDI